MEIDTARRLFLQLSRARVGLSEALAETIKTEEREAGERIFEAIVRVEEVIDECLSIAPTLQHLPHDDWPEPVSPRDVLMGAQADIADCRAQIAALRRHLVSLLAEVQALKEKR